MVQPRIQPYVKMAYLSLSVCVLLALASSTPLRAPAYPLVVHTPYISVWSPGDRLTDAFPIHWAGATIGMIGLVRVDGVTRRWLGIDTCTHNGSLAAAPQTSVVVGATTTTYTFEAGPGVALTAVFVTPVRGDALDAWAAAPFTLLRLSLVATDGRPHTAALFFMHTAELSVDDVATPVVWGRDTPAPIPGGALLRIGAAVQRPLSSAGDRKRISWGYQYLAASGTPGVQLSSSAGGSVSVCTAFVAGAQLPPDEARQPRPASDEWPVLALAWTLSNVTSAPTTVTAGLSYDEVLAMEFYGAPLPHAWSAGNGTIAGILSSALANAPVITAGCAAFDAALHSQLVSAGGEGYSEITELTHRQAFGSMVFTPPPPGMPDGCSGGMTRWVFMEEMSSDGDVSTVDVIYPAAAALLFFSPSTLWASMLPVLAYANNCTTTPYNKAWAPHDLGTWPIANRGPENQEDMMLEESANLLILAAAIANASNSVSFIQPSHWALFAGWASYVNASMPNPPAQLCTDDFAGPAPNNTNLVLKGVTALGGYARLLVAAGRGAEAAVWRAAAAQVVVYWLAQAVDSAGGVHYRRQYELAGSFSLKYNTCVLVVVHWKRGGKRQRRPITPPLPQIVA